MAEKKTIHLAIVAAMAEVHILGKDGKNSHQNYKFASIDAFLAMVNPIARKHGVFINITEIEDVELVSVKERNGDSLFGRFVYGITATGANGDSIEQSKQTVFLRFVGPQTTGQALAYAMKMYLRMLLLIPTGDADADLQKQVTATGVDRGAAGEGTSQARTDAVLDSLPPDADPRQKAVAFSEAIIADITKAKTAKGANNAWAKWSVHVNLLQEKHSDLYSSVFDAWEAATKGEE